MSTFFQNIEVLTSTCSKSFEVLMSTCSKSFEVFSGTFFQTFDMLTITFVIEIDKYILKCVTFNYLQQHFTRLRFLSFFRDRISSGSYFGAVVDSPGAPPSATAHELFRGFSYIAPIVSHDVLSSARTPTDGRSIANVRFLSDEISKYRAEFGGIVGFV